MKTKNYLNLCCRAGVLLALLPLALRASETANDAKDQKGDSPTHVLFTGSEIQVLYRGSLYQVRGVEGGSFIIKVKDKNVEIPMGKNPKALKVTRVQTLAERTVAVANFKYERAYTPANDPFRKGTQGILTTQGLHEQTVAREHQLRNAPTTVEEIKDGRKTGQLLPNPGVAEAQTRLDTVYESAAASNDFYMSEMGEEMAKELYDALDVQFELSSAKPIRSPYVVIMAKYHEKEDPQHPQNWLFAKALDPIGADPKKMFVREGGFPPGFVVEKLQVHLYEKGLEIATDLSENRAPLTRDEAHEYLVIDHVSTHKTETMPARVALTQLPEDWATRPKDESFCKTYYVKVDKDGHAVGTFEDEACRIKVADSYYAGVLRSMRFLPALEKGRATESVAPVKLNELPM